MEPYSEREAAPDKAFQAFLDAGEFRLQRCGGCRRHIFFPRTLCPHCGGGMLEWIAASGRGTVHSTTIVRQKPDRGGDYNIALIDLDEGVRMMSRVVGTTPDAVRIGQLVEAAIARVGDRNAVLFHAAKEGAR